MSFEKYLKGRNIQKTIDPTTGQKPKSPTSTQKTETDRVIKSSLKVLITDLITEAQLTQVIVKDAIDNIVQANISDSGFREYLEMVKANHFDPLVLLTDKNAKPAQVYSQNQIKAAERDVYRRLTDSRAPFIGDLHNLLAEAGLSEYSFKRIWEKMVDPNNLYQAFNEEERLIRYAISKERFELEAIRNNADRIKRNVPGQLSYEFLRAMSDYLINRLPNSNPRETLAEIDQILYLMKQIRVVLNMTSILNSHNWEQFATNVKDVYGDFLNFSASKIMRNQQYALFGGVNQGIYNLTSELEKHIPINIEINQLPIVTEFVNQISDVFTQNLAKIEDDLVARESIAAKLEESRQMMYFNSRKNHRTKQFIDMTNQIISFFESLKYALSNLANIQINESQRLLQTLVTGAEQYVNRVAILPHKSVKVENHAQKPKN